MTLQLIKVYSTIFHWHLLISGHLQFTAMFKKKDSSKLLTDAYSLMTIFCYCLVFRVPRCFLVGRTFEGQ